MIQKIVYVLVMLESQSHGSLEVSEAMIVGINEVKGEGPLDRTAASAWSSTYQAELITTNKSGSRKDNNNIVSLFSSLQCKVITD